MGGWVNHGRSLVHLTSHRDVQDHDVRIGDCKAFERGDVGGHGAAGLFPAHIRKTDREWSRGSVRLDWAFNLKLKFGRWRSALGVE